MAAASRRFQTPVDFEEVAASDGGVTCDPDTEIWLIKAPPDFTPESFSSRRLPLSGYKMQKVKAKGVRRFYHVLSSPRADASLRALLCHHQESRERLICAPPLQGVITVAEAHGDHSTLNAIPDRPPLTVPQGLPQRFQPFGALAPRCSSHNQSQAADSVKHNQSQAADSVKHNQSQAAESTKKKKAKKRRREEP